MDLPTQHIDPFHHLDSTLWERTKVAHITLISLGTLLMLPACFVLFGFAMIIQYDSMGGMGGVDSEVFLAVGSALVGAISGGFAWCALGLLFFKRSDARWQRIVWTICALFGYLTTPCALGWVGFMINEGPVSYDSSIGLFLLLLFLILGAAISCAVLGTRYTRLAIRSLKRPPSPPAGFTEEGLPIDAG